MPSTDPATPVNPAPRLEAIDALRGLAVVLMIQQHLGAWLFDVSHNWRAISAGWGYVNAAGGAAAPLFVLLAGAGLALGAERPGSSLVRRGALLFGFGVVLNLLTPSWLGPFSFYVLHLLGVVVMLGAVLRTFSDRTLLASSVVILAASVVARAVVKTPIRLDNDALRDASGTLGPLRLALVEGQFPLLPWLCFAIVGLWAGRRLGRPQALAGAGVLCLLLGLLLRLPLWLARTPPRRGPIALVSRFSFYPATPVFVCVLLGIVLLLVAAFVALGRKDRLAKLRWLVPLGRTSLTLLVVHVIVFREGAERLGLLHSFGALTTLLVIVLVLLTAALLASLWKRSGYAYGLEWWLRRAG